MVRKRWSDPRLLIAVVLSLLLAAPIFPGRASAIISTTIAIDGDMSDWVPVFSSAQNTMSDNTGAEDPDNPGTSSRDLSLVAFTTDSTYLYSYFRRTTSGNNSLTYNLYIDRTGDGLLDSSDVVVRYTFNGNAYQTTSVSRYVPSNSGGDPLGGDGQTPQGSEGTALPATGGTAIGAVNGIESECRIALSALNVTADTPFAIHFSSGQNAKLPGSIQDNTGSLTMRFRAVSVTPDNTRGTPAGTTVRYTHVVSNDGNGTDTFSLSTLSSQGWSTGITNTSGISISAVTLPARTATSVVVSVVVPAGTPPDTRDVTTFNAVCQADVRVSDSASDETVIGSVSVSPYRTGSAAAGTVVSFKHTVSNNLAQTASIDLRVASQNGWTGGIYDSTGTTPLGSVLLSPGATATVTCKISVPAGAALGTVDVSTVRATLSSDPSVVAIAYDTVTVQSEVGIAPSNASPAGPGTTASYSHTVSNGWSTTRTIDVTAVSSRGWTVQMYDQDGVSRITSVTLPPFGSRDIVCRVAVPAGTARGVVDTTTVTARFGTTSSTATDVTTAGNLVTYSTPGYEVPSATFAPGDSVYVRAMGITVPSVRFRWTDASGTVVYTSPLVGVDVTQIVGSAYSIPTTPTLGGWSVALLDGSNNQIGQPATFTVNVASYLTLTIDSTSIDFGGLDPGVPTVPRAVSVTVDSSGPYTIMPATSGDASALGLTVTGQANGLKPAGTRTFVDNYQLDPPWTTIPASPLHATVTYTVVQQ